MLLREEEARKKWCPYVIIKKKSLLTKSKTYKVTCEASHCMAWRWVILEGKNERDVKGYCGLCGNGIIEKVNDEV